MARSQQYTAKQVIEAIKGTGGIKTVIAQRLGCHRHTVDNYIERYTTVAQAYEDERETVADFAESVVVQNIRLAFQRQASEKVEVDSTDAKWFLAMKAKDRGYAERREVTGPEGESVRITVGGIDLSDGI
jgi:hypothetical protein